MFQYGTIKLINAKQAKSTYEEDEINQQNAQINSGLIYY